MKEVVRQVQECKNEAVGILHTEARKVISARECLNALSVNFDVRKVAACVKEKRDTFYVLCGWMAEKDALQFQKEVENDDRPVSYTHLDVYKRQVHRPPQPDFLAGNLAPDSPGQGGFYQLDRAGFIRFAGDLCADAQQLWL